MERPEEVLVGELNDFETMFLIHLLACGAEGPAVSGAEVRSEGHKKGTGEVVVVIGMGRARASRSRKRTL